MLLQAVNRIIISTIILIAQVTSQSTIKWLSDMDYYSFFTSFLFLDYNRDGQVSLNEAKLGILSILDSEYLSSQTTDSNDEFSDEVYAKYHTYQPSKYNCVPSIIAVEFNPYLFATLISSHTPPIMHRWIS